MYTNKLLLLSILFTFISACSGGSGSSDSNGEPQIEKPPIPVADTIRSATVKVNGTGTTTRPGLEYGSITSAAQWHGTGFFVDNSGYLVTNNHVAAGAGELIVEVNGVSETYNASVVAVAECADLAMLKLTTGSGFTALPWLEGEPAVNMPVGVAGFPGDVFDTVKQDSPYTYNEGIINTDVRRNDTAWASVDAFNHSAETSGGNSGGPVVNLNTGSVVGVHYAGSLARDLAISGATARDVATQLRQGHNVLSIGIFGTVVFLYQDVLGNLGLAWIEQLPDNVNYVPFGIWVSAVQAGSKASSIGIRPGDIIKEMAGVSMEQDLSLRTYCSVLETNNPNNPDDPGDKGKTVQLKIFRLSSGATCVGEINGNNLTLEGDPEKACPVTGGNPGGGTVNNYTEAEPNNSPQQAQGIVLPAKVSGSAKNDPDEGQYQISFPDGTVTIIEDVYSFSLAQAATVNIKLSTNNQADFDLYVSSTTDIATILSYSNNVGNVDEVISQSFAAGAYNVYIDAWDSVISNVSYTLEIQ